MPMTNVTAYTANPRTLTPIATNRRFGKSGKLGVALMAATFSVSVTRPPKIPIRPIM
jgi:hypothetical protein